MSGFTDDSHEIPLIDISSLSPQVGAALVDAAGKYGFVFIKAQGSSISAEETEKVFGLSRQFFASPRAEKEECTIGEENKGWSSMHSETLDPENQRVGDFKEAFNVGEFRQGKAQQPLPKSLVPHEADLSHFLDLCHELCLKILRLFALGLKIDPRHGGKEWFSSKLDPSLGPSASILRLLYYPALNANTACNPEVDIRAGAHSDYGSITLLFQRRSQPGLEILSPSSSWLPVPVTPPGSENDPMPPILVNIGDLLAHWTNGLLKSTVHRVVFPADSKGRGDDRYSIAYFCHPGDKTRLEPVPSDMVKAVSSESNGSGRAKGIITAGDYLRSRLAATYGWGSKSEEEVSPA
ncbi:MAG: hypothetical protein M1838_006142 [Thelocarpon superellum]|nr:MAG: hypothetical protein M1838_006142 [Thelocarpon superellum]